jgi:hypothetical protein
MNGIDYDYFMWLISQVATPPNSKTYNELFMRMHDLEFVWMVPNDDNRVKDGLELRAEFLDGARGRLKLEGVSILEVLVSLSRRVAFLAGGESDLWAWRLIKNLGLNRAADPITEAQVNRIENTLEGLVWRTYQPDGRGGFFPLKHPAKDQTKIEIWFQMNAYVIERDAR